MDTATIDYYKKHADILANQYEAVEVGFSKKISESFRPKSKILDIGCGSGRDLAYLATQGHDCYGVDAANEFVVISQKIHPELKGRITCSSLPSLIPPFNGGFDAVLCSAVLMHIEVKHLMAAAASIRRCLNTRGRILYSVPSKRLDVEAFDRDAHGRLFVPEQSSQLRLIFEQLGFKLISTWNTNDSLGREKVEWISDLMELTSNG
jgi:SAM-dependent methyltransferase